jgi:hypothetical protein
MVAAVSLRQYIEREIARLAASDVGERLWEADRMQRWLDAYDREREAGR